MGEGAQKQAQVHSSVSLTIACDQATSYPLMHTQNHTMPWIFCSKLSWSSRPIIGVWETLPKIHPHCHLLASQWCAAYWMKRRWVLFSIIHCFIANCTIMNTDHAPSYCLLQHIVAYFFEALVRESLLSFSLVSSLSSMLILFLRLTGATSPIFQTSNCWLTFFHFTSSLSSKTSSTWRPI